MTVFQNTQIALAVNAKTMSSKQIADVVNSRHDSVKRTIDTLAEKGVISYPQTVDGIKSANGVVEKLYMVNERDSYVVVAQLCPEFTAKLVDYWQATKNQQVAQPKELTKLEILQMAIESEQKVLALESKVSELEPKAKALDSIANATGLKTIPQAVKVLGVQPEKFLRPWMLANGWIHTAADGQYHAYAERIRAGHLKEKDRVVTHKSGTQEIKVTVYVTPHGETLLARRLVGEAA